MAPRKDRREFSLRRENATEGGGTEGALATITEIGFVEKFTYGGRFKDSPSAALHVVFNIDGFEKPWDQHYSVGPSDKYEVLDDGDSIQSMGKAGGLNKKCPCYHFIDAVQDAIEAAKLDLNELLPEEDGITSVRPLEGQRVRLTNKKLETVGGDLKEYVLIAAFEDANGNGAAPQKTQKTQKNNDTTVEAKTIAAVEALIEEHTSIKKGDLANLVYASKKKDTDAKAMMQLCFKDAWVADENRPWSFDKKKGLLRAAD